MLGKKKLVDCNSFSLVGGCKQKETIFVKSKKDCKDKNENVKNPNILKTKIFASLGFFSLAILNADDMFRCLVNY